MAPRKSLEEIEMAESHGERVPLAIPSAPADRLLLPFPPHSQQLTPIWLAFAC